MFKDQLDLIFIVCGDTIVSEIRDLAEERRTVDIPVAINFERNRTTKRMRLVPKVKKYSLFYEKRIIFPEDCTSRPYGYSRVRDEIDVLLEL